MKKFVFLIWLLATLCFITQKAWAVFFNPFDTYYTVKTRHFYIHYPRETAGVAQDLAEISERLYPKLTERYNWRPWGRTHVVLLDKSDSANGMTTVIPANYMTLFVTPPEADSPLDSYTNYLELLFTHEFGHVLHLDQHHRWADPAHWVFGKIITPNGLTPGWMREGLSVWAESEEPAGRGRNNHSYAEMVLRTGVYENNFPAIDQVGEGRIPFPGGNTQYIYGGKFIQWLSDKYGDSAIRRYMEEYSSGLWLFSLNNKARRVFNKSFYKLWKEWAKELGQKYGKMKVDLTRQGLTTLDNFVGSKDQLSYPTLSSVGGYAYSRIGLDEEARIVLLPKPGDKIRTIKRAAVGQMAFSRDGGKFLAFSSLSSIDKYALFAGGFVYDIDKKKMALIRTGANKKKKGVRVSDPDFAPLDGGNRWVIFVRTNQGTDNLFLVDRINEKGYYLTDAPKYTQFSNPRFSPDGKTIVVSRHDNGGNRDIVLYSNTGQEIRKITNDGFFDNHPIWSPDGRSIYFDSDKTGIPNLYRYDFAANTITRVTNVLSGVFQPQIAADGQTLYVQSFTGKGMQLRKIAVSGLGSFDVSSAASAGASPVVSVSEPSGYAPSSFIPEDRQETVALKDEAESETKEDVSPPVGVGGSAAMPSSFVAQSLTSNPAGEPEPVLPPDPKEDKKADGAPKTPPPPPSEYEKNVQANAKSPKVPEGNVPGAKKYNAFPQVLVPRYVLPMFTTLDSSFIFGAAIGRYDPLYRHIWNLYGNYRTDVGFLGGGGSYTYARYNPAVTLGFARYSINWGNIFGTGSDFFENRLQGYIGTSFVFGHHNLGLSYFYENRDNITSIPAGFSLVNLSRYAGFKSTYSYWRYKRFPNSISQEDGPLLKLGMTVTDSAFGSSQFNEQRIFTGDMRYYFEMPYSDHHVFGLRAAGGYVWGDRDQIVGGTLRFGGPFGEGNLAGYSDLLMPFRGLPGVTFAADRTLLFSAEYRLPLDQVERGIGTWPIYLNKLHMAFFTDYGDAWGRGQKNNVGFFDDFFLSVGSELRGNLTIGYGLPITARIGYAIILTNRDRIAGLTDSLFKNDIRNGTFYFQFGSSF